MPLIEALWGGDVKYEDDLLNIKRTVFVDRLAGGAFILNIYFGSYHFRGLVNGYELFGQLHRMGISFSEGWSIYNVRKTIV